jgi:hypothetical protein
MSPSRVSTRQSESCSPLGLQRVRPVDHSYLDERVVQPLELPYRFGTCFDSETQLQLPFDDVANVDGSYGHPRKGSGSRIP